MCKGEGGVSHHALAGLKEQRGVIYNFGSCFQVSAGFHSGSDQRVSAALVQRQKKWAGTRVRFQTR